MSEVILLGGSKHGLVTESVSGMNGVNNIVLNEEMTGPEYVDRYVPTNVKDRDGRTVYAHVGRYTAEESESYWDKLDKEQVDALVEQTKAEKAEAARVAEEEAKAAEEKAAAEAAEQAAEDAKLVTDTSGEPEKPEATEEVVEVPEGAVQDSETGEVTEEKPNGDQG